MESTLTQINESESEISFVLTPEDYADGFNKELKKEMSKVAVPGFRKGKVPVSVIEKYYGDSLQYQAMEKFASDFFFDYAEQNLKVLGRPSITDFDFKPSENLTYKVRFETTPQLSNLNYKGFEIEVTDIQVTDEMVDREYEGVLASKVILEPAEVIDGLDYSVKIELVAEDDGHGNRIPPQTMDVNLKQSKEEIKDALMNKKTGDDFNFEFTDTHSHHHEGEEEKEHTVTYKYSGKVLSVSKTVYPEATEELMLEMSNGEAKTAEEFKAIIKRDYSAMFESQMERQIGQKITAKLVELNDFVVGKSQKEYYLNKMVEEQIKSQKEKGKKVSKEALEKRLEPAAIAQIKAYHIEKAIIAAENITASEEKLIEMAKAEAVKLNYDYEEILKIYKSNDDLLDGFIHSALYDYLQTVNKITKVDKKTNA